MQSENKNCQNCKKDFIIEPDDFLFYKKINVPPPTWCSRCRMERRMSFGNTWSVFWRNCDKCGKKTLSIYPPEQEIKVYCSPCFWADDWDGTEYAMVYDPSRPFLEQVKELSNKTPFSPLDTLYTSLVNSEYSNGIAWAKNCYLTFWADYCKDVYYSAILFHLENSIDCIRGYKSELCYGSIGFIRCYNMFFSDECDDCINVWFCRNCYNCQNCIGCANLSGASYCIFNERYTKDEYEKRVKELNLESWEGLKNLEEKAYKFWLTKPYRQYNGHSLNLNVSGDHVYTSKNSKEMYIANGTENCKWTQFITVPTAKDCYDYSGWGNNSSLIYECASVGENANNIKFSYECFPDSLNEEYCFWCIAGKNNFGCVSLKRKQHCILNKEYSKDEYEKLKNQIIADMKTNPYVDKLGRKFFYGEFFPPEMSKFPYNKSNSMKFLPKTKEQALREGYSWSDKEDQFYKSTIDADSLPNTAKESKDSILNEIIKCKNCSNGYKIVKGEFDLLQKMNLPLPRECPKCRENKRFARMNKPSKLYFRNCAKCGIEVRTPYSPDRPEIIYCEKCYQQEVY